MTKKIADTIRATIEALEHRIETETAALAEVEQRRRAALIATAKGEAGAQDEADRLGAEVRRRKDDIRALREALDDEMTRLASVDAGTVEREHARAIEASQARARKMLAAAEELQDALHLVGEKYGVFFKSHTDFWNNAPLDVRAQLPDYMQGHSEIRPLIRLWLAFLGVLDGEMIWDRTQAPASIEAKMRLALGDHLPALGRPPKAGGEDDQQEAA